MLPFTASVTVINTLVCFIKEKGTHYASLGTLLLGLASFSLASCSQHGTSFTNQAYHNLTAHYNAYYLAKEKITEAEVALFQNRKDDYTRILDVITPLDSSQAGAVKTQAEYAIQKASIAIQRHKNSKWLDDSYLVVGKARHLLMDYPNAIETYKYVNTESKSPSAQHQAMIGMLQAFTEMKDYNYARAVIERLRKEKLKKRDLVEFYLARAQYHLQQQEYDPTLAVLKKTVRMMRRGERRARVHFIIAQLYQEIEKGADAYKHYTATLRNNPSFELAFYAKLHSIEVYQSKGAQGNRRLMANFRKLLHDAKNAEYKDKIYYHMALYEYREKRYQKAIDYLKQSVQANTTDAAQKGYSFLKMGEIYYDNLKQYDLAKMYYDSTLSSLPQTVPGYEVIAKRQKVLDSFVTNITTIETEDSLQNLARMDDQSLDALFEKVLVAEEEKQKELERLERRQMEQESTSIFEGTNPDGPQDPNARSNRGGGGGGGGNNASGTWYFANTAAVSQGRTAFARKWGNRAPEDNWRRSAREREVAFEEDPAQARRAATGVPPAEAAPQMDRKQRKETMLGTLPRTPEALTASNKKVEDAYYNLGKIYHLELQETPNALNTFDTLLTRYPESEYKPEVYYFLYIIHKSEANEQQETYKNKLLAEYPTSSFAKLVANPDYLKDDNLANLEAERAFSEAYQQYEYGNYADADRLVADGLNRFQTGETNERFKVLRIRIVGKTKGVNAYRDALNEFLSQHPESTLLPYVQNLLQATEGFANRSK
jgi:tetratricopeptide (TPR) repeat protein